MNQEEPQVNFKSLSWDELNKQKFYVFGPSLFLGVRALVYPSNLVKTRLQVQNHLSSYHYTGTLDAFRQIIRSEGPLGLYKGFGANALGILTGNLYITIYEMTRQTYLNAGTDPKYVNFISGGCASILSQTVVVPLDIISQTMMLKGLGQKSSSSPEVGFLDTCRSIWSKQGLRGFYRGYLPSVATYAPSSSIWWGCYGLLFPMYAHVFGTSPKEQSKVILAQALAGGTAGVIAAAVTNPMDVIRTRIQVSAGHDIWPVVQELKQERFGLLKGMSARMLAMGQSGVLVISTYELVKRLSKLDQ